MRKRRMELPRKMISAGGGRERRTRHDKRRMEGLSRIGKVIEREGYAGIHG